MELKLTAGMYSRALQGVSALLLVFLAAVVLASSMPSAKAQPSASGVMATYIEYNAQSLNWDLFAAGASCANLNGANPPEWRSKYWWTAFCGMRRNDMCGMCLQVTNVATGASETVRIVDDCGGKTNGGEALGLDTPVFNEIDNDGRGKFNGQLTVNYQFVNCYD